MEVKDCCALWQFFLGMLHMCQKWINNNLRNFLPAFCISLFALLARFSIKSGFNATLCESWNPMNYSNLVIRLHNKIASDFWRRNASSWNSFKPSRSLIYTSRQFRNYPSQNRSGSSTLFTWNFQLDEGSSRVCWFIVPIHFHCFPSWRKDEPSGPARLELEAGCVNVDGQGPFGIYFRFSSKFWASLRRGSCWVHQTLKSCRKTFSWNREK